jgi:hypothetical protein
VCSQPSAVATVLRRRLGELPVSTRYPCVVNVQKGAVSLGCQLTSNTGHWSDEFTLEQAKTLWAIQLEPGNNGVEFFLGIDQSELSWSDANPRSPRLFDDGSCGHRRVTFQPDERSLRRKSVDSMCLGSVNDATVRLRIPL